MNIQIDLDDLKTRKSIRSIGKHFAEGVTDVAATLVIIVSLCAILIISIMNLFSLGLDSTDKDGFHRSGLKLFTDYGAGVEYVSDGHSLTPRLKPDGTPVVIVDLKK